MDKNWLSALFQEHCILRRDKIEIGCFGSSGGMYTSLNIRKQAIRSDEEYYNEIVNLFEKTCSVLTYPEEGISWNIMKSKVEISLANFEDEEVVILSIDEFNKSIYPLTNI